MGKPQRKARTVAKSAGRAMTRKSRVITGEAPGAPIALYRSGTGRISIGGVDVNFYVLDDGSRIADMEAAKKGLGLSAERLLRIPGVPDTLPSSVLAHAKKQLVFRENETAQPKPCVLAEVIVHLCAATLSVRRANGLANDDLMYGNFAEMLLADVATKAARVFVDAITGSVMPKDSDPGDAMMSTITQPYFRTYPDEFYDELYRLRGLGAVPNYGKHPSYFGNLTNNIIYKRFAPGVLAALKDNSPRSEGTGKHRRKLFQMLSPDKQTELQEDYLPTVIEIMKSCDTFDEFIGKLDERFPIHKRVVRPKR